MRITHLPTGIVVTSSEKSQHPNRAQAMQVLRARLYDMERQRQDSARAADRKGQVGSGDRSERIRTYNFPQGRLTDHRVGLTLYKLDQVVQGDLGEVIAALVAADQAAGWPTSRREIRACTRAIPRNALNLKTLMLNNSSLTPERDRPAGAGRRRPPPCGGGVPDAAPGRAHAAGRGARPRRRIA